MLVYIPFSFARSALFAPAARSGELIDAGVINSAHYKAWDVELIYSGPELNPSHSLIWQVIVGYGMKSLFEPITIKLTQLLKDIGRNSMDTKSKRWMLEMLAQLSKANVHVTTPNVSFNGPLLGAITDSRGEVQISFDPQLSAFLDNEVVKVESSQKWGLSNHPLASWLFDYTATLKEAFNADIEQLHQMSGSSLTLAVFKIRLMAALETVKEKGGIGEYTINGNAIAIKKSRGRVVFKTDATPKHIGGKQRYMNAVQQANQQRIRVPL